MKKLFCMTIVSVCLIACSSEVGPIGTTPPADPLRWPYQDSGQTAMLADGGSAGPTETGDGGDTTPDAQVSGSAGSASVEPQDGGDNQDGSEVGPDSATPDSGAQALQLTRELFVGTWSGQVLNGGHPCGDEITVETVDCSAGWLVCGTETVIIDADYTLDPLYVDFLRWETTTDGEVWVGVYDNDFQNDHRSLRLWLIDVDTMLGEMQSGTVCVPWKLTRQ